MSAFDRKQLLDLTDIQKKTQNVKFAWGYQMCFSENGSVMQSFFVNEIGEDITIPVSLKKLDVLKKVMEHAVKTQGLEIMDPLAGKSLHINQNKIKTKSSESFMEFTAPSLLSLAARNLLGFEVNTLSSKIETNLVKLLLVEQGQRIKIHSKKENKPGTFAVMVVTIPVEGGFRGGKINVKHKRQKESFHFEENSDQHFSVVTFYVDCQHELEPITSGWMVAMVFHLNWLDALKPNTSPLEFPAFFKTFYEVRDFLIPWANSQSNNENTQVILETGSPNQVQSEGPNKDILLIFPLEEKYGNAELSFSELRGRDLLLARLFQSISFIDVHIAVVSQLVDNNQDHFIDWENHSDWKDRIVKIIQWIGWENSLPLSKELELDARTQLVGNISRIQSAANGPDNAVNQVIYCHAVLVIQPRYQSIIHACRLQLDDVLTHMEIQLSVIKKSDCHPVARQQLISTLKHVISFCWDSPLLTWMDSCPATEDRSRRLLELCINLNAVSEGLDLLNLLGTRHALNTKKPEACSLPDMYIEGIRNDKVAKAVADLASEICGWETCSELVLQLISPLRIFKQLAHFASLALYLMKNDCVEGTLVIADRVSSIVTKLDIRQTNYLNDYHIHTFLDMVIVLEDNDFTANTSRVDSVETLFKQLILIRQCNFLIKLQSGDNHLQPACQKLMKKLSGSLVLSDFHTSNSAETILPLMKCIVQLGDVDLIHMLVDKICLGPDSEEFLHSNVLLYSLLASPDILEVAKFSNYGRAAVLNLLDAGIKQLHEKISLPQNADENDPSRWNLASCLHLVLQLELSPEKRESQLVNASIGFMLFNLPTDRLCDLILDVQNLAGDSLVNHPITYKSYVDLCCQLSSRDRKSIQKLGKEKIIQLFKCFVWLEDLESTSSLIQQLGIDESWNQEDKDVLSNVILSWQDVLDHLIPASSVFVSNTIDIIMKAWVIDLTQRLESQEIGDSLENCQEYSVDDLDEEIIYCVELYLRNELKYPHAPDYGIQLFHPFVDKLTDWRLSYLLANIYLVVEIEESSRLADYSTCFDLCCLIGQQFILRDLNKLFKSTSDIVIDTVVDVMICLFWLGDDRLLSPFTRKICSISSSWQENVFVTKIVASSEARKLAVTCQANRTAFCSLLEQRISRLRMMKVRGSSVNQSPGLEQCGLHGILRELEEARILLHSLQDQSIVSEENNLFKTVKNENSIKRQIDLTVDDFITCDTPFKREKIENSPLVEFP